MIFQEVGPNENLDVRRFSSAPFGLWDAGILKMVWGKARVRLTRSRGFGGYGNRKSFKINQSG